MQARAALLISIVFSAGVAAAQQQSGYMNRLVWGDDVVNSAAFVQSTARPSPTPGFRTPATAPTPGVPLPASRPAPLTSQTENALKYFNNTRARATLAQIPQPPSTPTFQAAPANRRAAGKPFTGAPGPSTGPVLSPYLNLDREESLTDLPNYYTFVRPQFDQEAFNQRQQFQLGRLQQQVKQATYSAPGGAGAGAPGTGHSTRFGNTGRYYKR